YLRLYSEIWPQGNLPLPHWKKYLIPYLLTEASLILLHKTQKVQKQGNRYRSLLYLGVGSLSALISMMYLITISVNASFTPQLNAYASVFHVALWHLAAWIFG